MSRCMRYTELSGIKLLLVYNPVTDNCAVKAQGVVFGNIRRASEELNVDLDELKSVCKEIKTVCLGNNS